MQARKASWLRLEVLFIVDMDRMSSKAAPASHEHICAFVVDAGSSGNRLLLYTPEDMFPQGFDVLLDVSDLDLDSPVPPISPGGASSSGSAGNIYACTKRAKDQHVSGMMAVTMEQILAIEAGVACTASKKFSGAATRSTLKFSECKALTGMGTPGFLPDWLPLQLRRKGELLRRFADSLVKAIFDLAATSDNVTILSLEVLATSGVRALLGTHQDKDMGVVMDEISMTINRAFSKMLAEHPRNKGEQALVKGTSRGMRVIEPEEEHELEAIAVQKAASLAQLSELAGVFSMAGSSITFTAFNLEGDLDGRRSTEIDYGFKARKRWPCLKRFAWPKP